MQEVAAPRSSGAGAGVAAAAAFADAPPQQHRPPHPPRPVLLLIKGLPGTGKSTLARELARRLGWPLIDKDDARDCLESAAAAFSSTATKSSALDSSAAAANASSAAAPNPSAQPHEPIDWNGLSYSIMFRYAETQLSLGLSTILDCPFSREGLFRRAEEIAGKHGATIALIDCLPSSEAAWCARLEARGSEAAGTDKAHKPGSWADLQQLLDGYNGCWRWSIDGPAAAALQHRLPLDTTAGPPDAAAAEAVLWLQRQGLVVTPDSTAGIGTDRGRSLVALATADR